jgi:hypothetical protein
MPAKRRINLEKWSRSVIVLLAVFVALGELALALAPIPDPPPSTRERFGTRLYSGVPPVEVSIVNWQINNSLTQLKGSDILCLGDSSCLMGVVPSVIEKTTRHSCWNLGTLGYLGTQGHALILEQWLKRFGAPRLLVYHVVPHSLVSSNTECSTYFKPLKEWLSSSTEQEWYDRLPTSVARRYLFWQLQALASSLGRPDHNLDAPRGVYPSDRKVAAIMREDQGYLPEFQPTIPREKWTLYPFKPFNQDCAEGLKQIFQLSSQYNFPVYVVMHAVPDVYEGRSTETAYSDYERNLKKAATGFAQVQIAKPLLTYMPTEKCANLHHLTPEGAISHSQDLANSIRRFLDRPSLLVSTDKEVERR